MDAIAGIVAVVLTFLVMVLLMPLLGGICGWLFAIVFDATFAELQGFLGVGASGFEMGAALGFVSSFFRGTAKS